MTRRHASRNRGIVRRHTRSQYRPERGIVDTITPVRSRADAATEPPRSEVWRAPHRLRAIEALPEQRGETSPEAREQEDSRLEKPANSITSTAWHEPRRRQRRPHHRASSRRPRQRARLDGRHTRAWGTVHDAPPPHSSRTSHPEEGAETHHQEEPQTGESTTAAGPRTRGGPRGATEPESDAAPAQAESATREPSSATAESHQAPHGARARSGSRDTRRRDREPAPNSSIPASPSRRRHTSAWHGLHRATPQDVTRCCPNDQRHAQG